MIGISDYQPTYIIHWASVNSSSSSFTGPAHVFTGLPWFPRCCSLLQSSSMSLSQVSLWASVILTHQSGSGWTWNCPAGPLCSILVPELLIHSILILKLLIYLILVLEFSKELVRPLFAPVEKNSALEWICPWIKIIGECLWHRPTDRAGIRVSTVYLSFCKKAHTSYPKFSCQGQVFDHRISVVGYIHHSVVPFHRTVKGSTGGAWPSFFIEGKSFQFHVIILPKSPNIILIWFWFQ